MLLESRHIAHLYSVDRSCYICVLILLYYVCILMLESRHIAHLYSVDRSYTQLLSPHTITTIFCYICVLIPPLVTRAAPHSATCPHTTAIEHLLLYASSYYYYILLYICLHISVTSLRAPL